MKYNYYYKVDKFGFPIPGFLVRRKHKPAGNWIKIINPVACCGDEVCGVPVQFSCVEANFFIEFYNVEQDTYTDIYSASGASSFEAQIPQGTYDVFIQGLVANAPFYINGEIYGNADGGGNATLSGYDTTTIESIGQCDDNGNIEVTFVFNSISSSVTDDELSGLVQQTIFTEDGLTILAQSVLGGGQTQTFTIPYVPIKYCVDVPVVFVQDDLDPFPALQTAGSFPTGSILLFYNPNVATETCDAGGTLPTPTYTVSLGDGGGN